MSIDQEMEEILQLFFEESLEGLDTMESGLLTLDNSADRGKPSTPFFAPRTRSRAGPEHSGSWKYRASRIPWRTLLDEMRNGTRGITPDALQVLFAIRGT